MQGSARRRLFGRIPLPETYRYLHSLPPNALQQDRFCFRFSFLFCSEPVLTLSLNFAALFLPGLITGITAIWHPTIFRTFEDFTRPSLFLLPAFSFFTFKSNTPKCCSGDILKQMMFISDSQERGPCLTFYFRLEVCLFLGFTILQLSFPFPVFLLL